MFVDGKKLELAIARACLKLSELASAASVSPHTILRIIDGANTKPATVGKIAKALGVDPTEITETEE